MRPEANARYIYPMVKERIFDPGSLAWRIEKRLKAVGKSAKAASEQADLSPSFIKNIFDGVSKSPRTDSLRQLAPVLETSFEWLSTGNGSEEAEGASTTGYRVEPNAVFEPGPVSLPPTYGPRDIEELGITVGGFGGDDEAFEFNGQVIDLVKRPYGILNRKDVFALRVSNDSMAPRYEDGDRVFVEPRKPAIRDYVVIELKPIEEGRAGKSFLKRLVSMDAAGVVVEQYNPKGRLEFSRNEILRLLRVIPDPELRGEQ